MEITRHDSASDVNGEVVEDESGEEVYSREIAEKAVRSIAHTFDR